jgi:hypothetical protein
LDRKQGDSASTRKLLDLGSFVLMLFVPVPQGIKRCLTLLCPRRVRCENKIRDAFHIFYATFAPTLRSTHTDAP